MLARLLVLAAPPSCVACRRPTAHAEAPLCPSCAGSLPWLGPTCPRCGLPRCGPCPARGAAFAAAWAPWALAGAARALVHALKFRGALGVADALAAPMAAGAPAWVPRGPAVPGAAAPEAVAAPPVAALVPVPADPLRARRRGADHTALLARALAARLDLPVHPCLARRTGRGRQVGAGRTARRAAVRAAVRASGDAPPAAVLVDDVHTTGATLDTCARVLIAHGARQVVAVTAARTLPT